MNSGVSAGDKSNGPSVFFSLLYLPSIVALDRQPFLLSSTSSSGGGGRYARVVWLAEF